MPNYTGVTYDGEPHLTLGGVGRNLATGIELLGHRPIFITSLGQDNLGQFARAEMHKLLGEHAMESRVKILEWSQRVTSEDCQRVASSCFALVLIDSLTGQCEYVIANLEAKRAITRENLAHLDAYLERGRTPLMVLDANLPGATLDYLFELCHNRRVPIFLEPTDVACLESLVSTIKEIKQTGKTEKLNSLSFLSPNVIELCELVRLFRLAKGLNSMGLISKHNKLSADDIEALARELMSEHMTNLTCLLVTMDKRGLLVVSPNGLHLTQGLLNQLEELYNNKQYHMTTSNNLVVKYYSLSEVIESPVSSSGAGDCFASGFISGLLCNANLDECVAKGFRASLCALKDESTVPDSLRELSKFVVENK